MNCYWMNWTIWNRIIALFPLKKNKFETVITKPKQTRKTFFLPALWKDFCVVAMYGAPQGATFIHDCLGFVSKLTDELLIEQQPAWVTQRISMLFWTFVKGANWNRDVSERDPSASICDLAIQMLSTDSNAVHDVIQLLRQLSAQTLTQEGWSVCTTLHWLFCCV